MSRTQIDDLAVTISADTSALAGDLRRAQNEFTSFKKSIEAASRDALSARANAKEAAAHRESIRQARDQANANHGVTASFLKMTGANLAANVAFSAMQTAGLGVVGVLDQIKESVNFAADLERTAISFEVMLQSGERAVSLMAELRTYAAQTPFGARETTDAARQLLAFGTAANDILPTLRFLGNVTAPIQDTTSLKDMIYLYGTLQTQGRAYAQDIRQFTGRGIPIIDALATEMKVAKGEISGLVEEGKVGFPQVARALQSMQAEGGPFAGLMEKQSQSFHGLVEQAKSAADEAKVHFGKILIEDLGLKAVVRDFESFARNVDGGMDRIRPAARMAGDFGRAVGNVFNELGKATLQSGNIFLDMAGQLPAFKEAAGALRDMMKGAQDFKIDPVDVANLAIETSKAILKTGAGLVTTIATMGEAFEESILRPMIDAIKFIRDVNGGFKRITEDTKPKLDALNPFWHLEQYRAKFGDVDPAKAAEVGRLNTADDDPLRKNIRDAAEGLKNFTKSLDESNRAIDQIGRGVRERLNADANMKKWEAEGAADRQRTMELKSSLAVLKAFQGDGLGGIKSINPFPLAGLAGGMGGLQSDYGKGNALAAIGGGMMGVAATGGAKAGGLSFDDKPGPHDFDLARRAKDDFNPLAKLNRELADLDRVLKHGLISKDEFAFQRDKSVRGVADGLGIGGPFELPDAAMKNTTESTRLLNMWQAGGGQKTTEDLLRDIRELLRRRNTGAEDHERQFVIPEIAKIGD